MKRLGLVFALLVVLITPLAFAQTAVPPQVGTVVLTASPSRGAGTVSATLTWSATATADGTAVQSCLPSWQVATVGASGTATVQVSKTTAYTLICTWDDLSAVLNWVPPTANTDNSAFGSTQLPLTYTVNAGVSGQELAIKTGVESPYTVSALTAGKTCFTVAAVDALGGSSVASNESCKTLGTATAQATASVTVTVIPQAPTALKVQ
jgi:hypothetical protein